MGLKQEFTKLTIRQMITSVACLTAFLTVLREHINFTIGPQPINLVTSLECLKFPASLPVFRKMSVANTSHSVL
jgi:hypothetical protein